MKQSSRRPPTSPARPASSISATARRLTGCVFRDYYGPTHKAFAALDTTRGAALEADIVALLDELNIAGPGSLVVPGEYVEVVIVKDSA